MSANTIWFIHSFIHSFGMYHQYVTQLYKHFIRTTCECVHYCCTWSCPDSACGYSSSSTYHCIAPSQVKSISCWHSMISWTTPDRSNQSMSLSMPWSNNCWVQFGHQVKQKHNPSASASSTRMMWCDEMCWESANLGYTDGTRTCSVMWQL